MASSSIDADDDGSMEDFLFPEETTGDVGDSMAFVSDFKIRRTRD